MTPYEDPILGDTREKDQPTIGDDVSGSYTSNGVLYVDSSGNLQNDMHQVNEINLFGGLVTGFYLSPSGGDYGIGAVDATGAGGTSGTANITTSGSDVFTNYMLVDLSGAPKTIGSLTHDPTDYTNSSFGIVFQGLGIGSPELWLTYSSLAMNVPIAMGTQKIVNLGDPTDAQDALTKNYFDTNLAGTTNTTAFTPTSDYHVATKKYVDDNGGGSPGGSDTQVQINDSGAFGASSRLAVDKTTGKLTITADSELTTPNNTSKRAIEVSNSVNTIFYVDQRTGATGDPNAVFGLGWNDDSGTPAFYMEETDEYFRFRGHQHYATGTYFDINLGSGQQTTLSANGLSGELVLESNTLTLEPKFLTISVGSTIGHAAINIKTSNAGAMYISGSNTRRVIKIANSVTSYDSGVQLSVETDFASYTAGRFNAGVTTPTANIFEVQRNGTDSFVVDKDGKTQTLRGRIKGVTRVTTTYTILETDEVVFANTDSAGYTVTLFAGVDGQTITIKNTGSSGNVLTIAPDGSEHLLGANLSFTLNDGEDLEITYNATDGWY